MIGYVVFTDLKGFSKLSEAEITVFFKDILPLIHSEIHQLSDKAKVLNTWGDAFFLIFEKGEDAIEWMFKYRNIFNGMDFKRYNLKSLLPRIAGHLGEFELFNDPFLKKQNAIGHNINTTARVEPITKEGEIYVTKPFKSAIEELPKKIKEIKFDELGTIPLAKQFGDMEIYRLRRREEKEQIIDKLIRLNLEDALPEPPELTNSELKNLDFLRAAPSYKIFEKTYKATITEASSEYKIEIAQLLKQYGKYQEAIKLIENVEKEPLEVDGINIYPYQNKVSVQKLKANCLSRINQYENASNIVYSLWKFGVRDSDTLSMLAAQYKRRALYNEKNIIDKDKINIELLTRSKDLYIEAFRLDISDYYPAINAAYLYKIIGGLHAGKGTQIANYIIDSFSDLINKNWWLVTTLAEAEILRDGFIEAKEIYEQNISLLQPDAFSLQSTIEQLYIYSNFTTYEKEVKEVISYLESSKE
jgi:class 3 adenylate cyclase